MSIDVSHLQDGDWVEAEFRELSPPEFNHSGRMVMQTGGSEPTGRTYTASGIVRRYAEDGLSLKTEGPGSGQAIRQTGGSPGGWLVRIIAHNHGGKST